MGRLVIDRLLVEKTLAPPAACRSVFERVVYCNLLKINPLGSMNVCIYPIIGRYSSVNNGYWSGQLLISVSTKKNRVF